MPWGGSPSTDESDAIRLLVGDTDAAKPLLSDDAYILIIATEARLYGRAALACETLAGKYATAITRRVGDLWHEAKTRGPHYEALAVRYRLEAARRGKGAPFAGGVNVADVDTRKADDRLVQPFFETGMMDSVLIAPASTVNDGND